ncbi:hypothetical protein, partial [Alishewanella longhuensis]
VLSLSCNGQSVPCWQAITLKQGDELALGMFSQGGTLISPLPGYLCYATLWQQCYGNARRRWRPAALLPPINRCQHKQAARP